MRGGGHNVAGRAVTEGGLMIDLSPMKGIRVDPSARTLHAQPGVIWSELNREAALHGLATTGGLISTTGIAGYTLGGGLGWLMSKVGLAADNLLGVELVTATGDVLDVTEETNPDLLWALRGGGGNFGIAASLEYRLHPFETIYGGLVGHPFEAAKDVLTFVRDFAPTLSDDASIAAGLVHAPDGSGTKLAAYLLFHTGEPEQAQAEFEPALSFGLPLITQVGPMPYPVMNTLLDDGYPRGALNYWKSTFISSLDDELIDSLAAAFAEVPSPMSCDPLRVLPRSGDAGRGEPRPRCPTERRASTCSSRLMGRSRGHPGEHPLDAGDVRAARAVPRGATLAELPGRRRRT